MQRRDEQPKSGSGGGIERQRTTEERTRSLVMAAEIDARMAEVKVDACRVSQHGVVIGTRG
jgi:hypothetical protein